VDEPFDPLVRRGLHDRVAGSVDVAEAYHGQRTKDYEHLDRLLCPELVSSPDYASGGSFWGPGGRVAPPQEPLGGAFQSATTHNTTSVTLAAIVSTLQLLLGYCEMPFNYADKKFKFRVSGYFPSGYARMRVRIWSRKTPGDYAVEVVRDRGERLMVVRFFDLVVSALTRKDVPAEPFNPTVFDWAPHKIPESFMKSIPMPNPDSVDAGIKAVADMAGSRYDDVAVNGCASVAKLAAASDFTKRAMACHKLLMETLVNVIGGDQSMDTKTNAMMALSQLVEEVEGQRVLVSCNYRERSAVDWIAYVLTIDAEENEDQFEQWCLQRYGMEALYQLVTSRIPDVVRAVTECKGRIATGAARGRECTDYAPLREASERVASHIS